MRGSRSSDHGQPPADGRLSVFSPACRSWASRPSSRSRGCSGPRPRAPSAAPRRAPGGARAGCPRSPAGALSDPSVDGTTPRSTATQPALRPSRPPGPRVAYSTTNPGSGPPRASSRGGFRPERRWNRPHDASTVRHPPESAVLVPAGAVGRAFLTGFVASHATPLAAGEPVNAGAGGERASDRGISPPRSSPRPWTPSRRRSCGRCG